MSYASDALIDALERKCKKLEVENAKLVKVLHEVESEAVYAYRCLQHDCEHMVNEQSELFRKYWHEQCVSDCIKAENAKLRELARDMYRSMWACDHEKCPHGGYCDKRIEFMPMCILGLRARELRIEVDK